MLTSLIDNWDFIRETGSFFADICILFITVVTFKRTFFLSKLKIVGFAVHNTLFNGNSFTIDLKNRSLSPQVIQKIYLIVENHELKVYDDYCKIDGFITQSIDTDSFDKIISSEGKEVNFNAIFEQPIKLRIETWGGKKYYIKSKTINAIQRWYYQRKKYKYKPFFVNKRTYNNHIVLDDMKYALDFVDHENKLHTIFILETGLMSDISLGFNVIRPEDMKDYETVDAFFYKQFKKLGLKYTLTDLSALHWKTSSEN